LYLLPAQFEKTRYFYKQKATLTSSLLTIAIKMLKTARFKWLNLLDNLLIIVFYIRLNRLYRKKITNLKTRQMIDKKQLINYLYF
jgi:hypothetical protein